MKPQDKRHMVILTSLSIIVLVGMIAYSLYFGVPLWASMVMCTLAVLLSLAPSLYMTFIERLRQSAPPTASDEKE